RPSQPDAVEHARTNFGHAGRSPVATGTRGRACPGHFFAVVPASVLHKGVSATPLCRMAHIPSHLVVTPRFSHPMPDLSMRSPHDVSSSPTAICMEMRHGTDRQNDSRKPHHHRRFPRRSDLRPAPWRHQGVCRVYPRLPPLDGFSALPQSQLQREWSPDTLLALCPCAVGWSHHLAGAVHHVPSGIHGAPPFRLALSSYEPRRGQASVDRHPRGTELRMVRRDLEYLAHGALSRALCLWATAHGACVDAV